MFLLHVFVCMISRIKTELDYTVFLIRTYTVRCCLLLSFLGCVDKIGIAFEAPTIATGFGAYLAQVGRYSDTILF